MNVHSDNWREWERERERESEREREREREREITGGKLPKRRMNIVSNLWLTRHQGWFASWTNCASARHGRQCRSHQQQAAGRPPCRAIGKDQKTQNRRSQAWRKVSKDSLPLLLGFFCSVNSGRMYAGTHAIYDDLRIASRSIRQGWLALQLRIILFAQLARGARVSPAKCWDMATIFMLVVAKDRWNPGVGAKKAGRWSR